MEDSVGLMSVNRIDFWRLLLPSSGREKGYRYRGPAGLPNAVIS
jgi:hypothetical protein